MPYIERDQQEIVGIFARAQYKGQEFIPGDTLELIHHYDAERLKNFHFNLIKQRMDSNARKKAIQELKQEGKLPLDYEEK